jgi:hypothetical protein
MNERMLKLYLQALGVNYIPVPVEDHIPLSVEKFAELIVRECISLCQESINDGCVEAEEPMRKIKIHFGVES